MCTIWRQSKVYVTPTKGLKNSPPPTFKVLSHNLEKKYPSAFIFHHLQTGYHILLLQELNVMPSLPHCFSHGDTKSKIFTNINKHEKKNGTAVVVSSELRPYVKFIPHSDEDGLMCSIELTLPGGPSTLFTSLYSPPLAISRRPLIEINLSRLASRYPHHIVGGDFNCIRNPSLDSLHSDSNMWVGVTSKTSGSNPAWVDMGPPSFGTLRTQG